MLSDSWSNLPIIRPASDLCAF